MLDLVDVIKKRMKYCTEKVQPESIEFHFNEIETKLILSLIELRALREHYSSSKPTSE